MSPKIKLTYFDIEGVAEPVRLTMLLSGTEFEDVRVKFPDWAKLKPTTPHGVLPVMNIDDGPMRGQSGAMLRWAATLNKEKSLYPMDKIYDVEEAIGVVDDAKRAWMPAMYLAMRPQNMGYPEDYAKTDEGKAKVESMRKAWIADELPKYLKYLSDLIEAKGGKFLAGEEPTIADCVAVPFLRGLTRGFIDHVDKDCLEKNPVIVAYIKRFCSLPEIKDRYTDGLH